MVEIVLQRITQGSCYRYRWVLVGQRYCKNTNWISQANNVRITRFAFGSYVDNRLLRWYSRTCVILAILGFYHYSLTHRNSSSWRHIYILHLTRADLSVHFNFRIHEASVQSVGVTVAFPFFGFILPLYPF